MSRDFDDLCRLSRAEHDEIFTAGTPPAFEELDGFEFRGWNASLLPRLGGFQKFIKGFYRRPAGPAGEGEGFNSPAIQNGLDGEWLGLPADDEPKRFGFYRVAPLPHAPPGTPPGSLLLDYGAHAANPRLDPSRLLRDFLVKIGGNPDLLLGKAHLALGRLVFAGYFVLERRRRHSFRG
jgi:hypothetical protein